MVLFKFIFNITQKFIEKLSENLFFNHFQYPFIQKFYPGICCGRPQTDTQFSFIIERLLSQPLKKWKTADGKTQSACVYTRKIPIVSSGAADDTFCGENLFDLSVLILSLWCIELGKKKRLDSGKFGFSELREEKTRGKVRIVA